MTRSEIALLVAFMGTLEVLIVTIFVLLDSWRQILKQLLLRKIHHVRVR